MTEILILSTHDYRSPRRVNVHFIAEAASRIADRVSFFSIGFSYVSLLKDDPRKTLRHRANQWEKQGEVDCYLWKTPVHPFNLKGALASKMAACFYREYAQWHCPALDERARSASVIMLESGLSPIFITRLRALAPEARFIYIASDLLSTIRVHPFVQTELDASLDAFDLIQVPARAMIPAFAAAGDRVAFIPHAIDGDLFLQERRNPYRPGQHIISVGSMLFDPTFFQMAAPAFPDVTFHVIGAKGHYDLPENVRQYPETPFEETLPYLKHADAGAAPYRNGAHSHYLADSSMKLGQYGHIGLPAICPHFAVGDYAGRFGYEPGDRNSIITAVARALAPGQARIELPSRDWTDVTREILISAQVEVPLLQ
jgi:2-beta-glucuronyltransferase